MHHEKSCNNFMSGNHTHLYSTLDANKKLCAAHVHNYVGNEVLMSFYQANIIKLLGGPVVIIKIPLYSTVHSQIQMYCNSHFCGVQSCLVIQLFAFWAVFKREVTSKSSAKSKCSSRNTSVTLQNTYHVCIIIGRWFCGQLIQTL